MYPEDSYVIKSFKFKLNFDSKKTTIGFSNMNSPRPPTEEEKQRKLERVVFVGNLPVSATNPKKQVR